MTNDHVSRKPFSNISNVVPSMKRKFSNSFTRAVSHSNLFKLISNEIHSNSTSKSKPSSQSQTNSLSIAEEKSRFVENLNSHLSQSTSNDSDFEGDTIIDPEPVDKTAENRHHFASTSNIIHGSLNHDIRTKSQNDTDDEALANPGIESPTQRSRRIRRIHSTFQTAKEKQDYQFEDNGNLIKSSISTFKVSSDILPRIDAKELAKIVNFNTFFDEIIIIDSRFNYEYNGGHIKNAINLSNKQDLTKFFHSKLPINSNHKQLLIFHCEFSVFRGPTMAQQLRTLDRQFNIDSYPFLSYPDIVILDGGYSRFYKQYGDLCTGGYIEMKDESFEKNCDTQLHRVRQDSKLTRAKSYNQFSPNMHTNLFYTDHTRSRSYTTITGEKVLKRQKSNTQFAPSPKHPTLSRSSSTFSNVESIFNSPIIKPTLFDSQLSEIDFQPPTAFFQKSHRKSNSSSFSLSSVSMNSSLSSISFENEYSNSADSLNDGYSPSGEENDYFDPINDTSATTINDVVSSLPLKQNVHSSVQKSTSIKDCLHRLQSSLSTQLQPVQLQFSNLRPKNRPNLRVVNTSAKFIPSPSYLSSSPITSPNPMFDKESSSMMDSANSLQMPSIIDPVSEVPVDFAIPSSLTNTQKTTTLFRNHTRKRSGSLLSPVAAGFYNFASLDIDEADEGSDNDMASKDLKQKKKTSEEDEGIYRNPFN